MDAVEEIREQNHYLDTQQNSSCSHCAPTWLLIPPRISGAPWSLSTGCLEVDLWFGYCWRNKRAKPLFGYTAKLLMTHIFPGYQFLSSTWLLIPPLISGARSLSTGCFTFELDLWFGCCWRNKRAKPLFGYTAKLLMTHIFPGYQFLSSTWLLIPPLISGARSLSSGCFELELDLWFGCCWRNKRAKPLFGYTAKLLMTHIFPGYQFLSSTWLLIPPLISGARSLSTSCFELELDLWFGCGWRNKIAKPLFGYTSKLLM